MRTLGYSTLLLVLTISAARADAPAPNCLRLREGGLLRIHPCSTVVDPNPQPALAVARVGVACANEPHHDDISYDPGFVTLFESLPLSGAGVYWHDLQSVSVAKSEYGGHIAEASATVTFTGDLSATANLVALDATLQIENSRCHVYAPGPGCICPPDYGPGVCAGVQAGFGHPYTPSDPFSGYDMVYLKILLPCEVTQQGFVWVDGPEETTLTNDAPAEYTQVHCWLAVPWGDPSACENGSYNIIWNKSVFNPNGGEEHPEIENATVGDGVRDVTPGPYTIALLFEPGFNDYVSTSCPGDLTNTLDEGTQQLHARIHFSPFDFDVDSDNSGGDAGHGPDRTQAEEDLEEHSPGHVLYANNDDDDADGVTDYDDDFTNAAEDDFSLAILELPDFMSRPGLLESGGIKLTYSTSWFRVWTKPGNAPRTSSDILEPYTFYTLSSLGVTPGQTTLPLWIEALPTTARCFTSDFMTASAYPWGEDGDDISDRVALTIVPQRFVDLDIDSDNDGFITESDDEIEWQAPGRVLCVGSSADMMMSAVCINDASFGLEHWKLTWEPQAAVEVWTNMPPQLPRQVDPTQEYTWIYFWSAESLEITAFEPGEVTFQLQATYEDWAAPVTDTVVATVVAADLEIDSNNDEAITPADDDVEDDPPGKYILYNWNDSDGNGVFDLQETDLGADDPDLQELRLTPLPEGWPGAQWSLAWGGPAGPKVAVWRTRDKSGTPIVSGAWYGWSPSDATLYVEGIAVGSDNLQWSYRPLGNPDIQCTDSVQVTVASVDLDIDSDNDGDLDDDDELIEEVEPGKIVPIGTTLTELRLAREIAQPADPGASWTVFWEPAGILDLYEDAAGANPVTNGGLRPWEPFADGADQTFWAKAKQLGTATITLQLRPLPGQAVSYLRDEVVATVTDTDCNDNDIPDTSEPFYCIGDMNCDGQVDFGDINPFVDAVLCASQPDPEACWEAQHPGCRYWNADITQDCVVDFGDINPFVDMLTTNPLPIMCD